MALKHFAYIYLSPGFSSENNTIESSSDQCKFTAVGIELSKKEEVIGVAKALAKKGVQMIELCGGFGPTWVSRVSQELGPSIPVGGAMYGPEWRKPLLDILKVS